MSGLPQDAKQRKVGLLEQRTAIVYSTNNGDNHNRAIAQFTDSIRCAVFSNALGLCRDCTPTQHLSVHKHLSCEVTVSIVPRTTRISKESLVARIVRALILS